MKHNKVESETNGRGVVSPGGRGWLNAMRTLPKGLLGAVGSGQRGEVEHVSVFPSSYAAGGLRLLR